MMSSPPPWNPNRFFETLNYFQVLPVVREIQRMFFTPPPPPPTLTAAGVLFDFTQPTTDLRSLWGAVDDVVMGGVSASQLQLGQGGAQFTGYVSTANSGGFASVRTKDFAHPVNLSSHQGIMLRVKGDGQRYKFLLRDEATWDGMAYSYSFDTPKNQWTTIYVPFEKMIPVRRAKRVREAPDLNPSQVRSLQIMLSKFEYDGDLNPRFVPGPFLLEISEIGVYGNHR